MFSSLNIGFLSASLGVSALLMGCAAKGPNDGSHAMDTSDPSGPQAMTCSQCKTVLVRVQVTRGAGKVARLNAYKTVEKDMCPDCRNNVENFFATGHFEHGCKACGGQMTACTPQ